MDPNATLEKLRRAYATSDFSAIRESSESLIDWIKGGGFIPVLDEPQLSAMLVMSLAYGTARKTVNVPREGFVSTW